MALHELSVQTAIYDALIAANITYEIAGTDSNGQRNTAPVPIFDAVPTDPPYPHIQVGDDTGFDVGTKTIEGQEMTLTIHTRSQYNGRREVKMIHGLIYNALHDRDITVVNACLAFIRNEYNDTTMEEDGKTRHGVMRFRLRVYDAPTQP